MLVDCAGRAVMDVERGWRLGYMVVHMGLVAAVGYGVLLPGDVVVAGTDDSTDLGQREKLAAPPNSNDS